MPYLHYNLKKKCYPNRERINKWRKLLFSGLLPQSSPWLRQCRSPNRQQGPKYVCNHHLSPRLCRFGKLELEARNEIKPWYCDIGHTHLYQYLNQNAKWSSLNLLLSMNFQLNIKELGSTSTMKWKVSR